MLESIFKVITAVAAIVAVVTISACSGAEAPATGDTGDSLQAQSAPAVDQPPSTVSPEPTPTPVPPATPTDTVLKTEIVDESVSPVSPPAAPEQKAMILSKELPAGSETPVQAAIADLSEQEGILPEDITVVSVEAVEWNDSSLGCPKEGFMYAQVITPGFLVTLEAQGQIFEYHTDSNQNVVLCRK